MPELPEVETTLLGLKPYLEGQPLLNVQVRTAGLRTPIPTDLPARLIGQTITHLRRRNKFILADTNQQQTLLIHLGMSGRFSIILPTDTPTPLAKHDHIILTTPLAQLRFNDARRFGLFELHPTATIYQHRFLTHLGPEPLTPAFTAHSLHAALQGSKQPIKVKIMDNHVVVGVGNIYASESLYLAGILPTKPANSLTLAQCQTLVQAIRTTLTSALAAGGSTLRDYQQPTGQLGYFQHQFAVYGRKNQPCITCSSPIQHAILAQRSTFWCPICQP